MKNILKLFTAIACICMLFACSKSNDEVIVPLNNSSQPDGSSLLKSQDETNRSTPDRYTWENVLVPIYCGGEKIDELFGTLTSHIVPHYENGVYISQNEQYTYALTSKKTGELFNGKDKFHFEGSTWMGSGHMNVRGNAGSHYILRYIWDPSKQEDAGFTFTDAVCIEND